MAEALGRAQLLQDAKMAKDQRAEDRRRQAAAVAIQAGARGLAARRALGVRIRTNVDQLIGPAFDDPDSYKTAELPLAADAFKALKALFFAFRPEEDRERFFRVARYLLTSIETKDVKRNWTSLALGAATLGPWVSTMKVLLWRCVSYVDACRMELGGELRELSLGLHVLVSFTGTASWALLRLGKGEALRPTLNALCANVTAALVQRGLLRKLGAVLRRGLCRAKPTLRHVSLSAILTLSLRPLMAANWPEEMFTQFLSEIFAVPALLHFLDEQAPECVALLMSQRVFGRTLAALTGEGPSRAVFTAVDGVGALGLLANLIQLGSVGSEMLAERLLDFTNVVTRIVDKCGAYVLSQRSQTSHWHPVLGWFAQPLDSGTQAVMPLVVRQLQRLWSPAVIRCLFAPLEDLAPPAAADPAAPSKGRELSGQLKGLMRSLVDKGSTANSSVGNGVHRLGSPETTTVGLVCVLYESALSTFTQLRYDILSGLAFRNFLLPRLWGLIGGFGGGKPAKAYLELLVACPSATAPEFHILRLFCELATYLITILDDMELYEQGTPLSLPQLSALASFLNAVYVKSVWGGLIDVGEVEKNPLLRSVHGLLVVLAHRHARRPLSTNASLWLMKDVKGTSLVAELDKGNRRAEVLLAKVPHIVAHKDRVVLFRKLVGREASGLGGGPSHLVTIQRGRIVEDAYRQLSLLSTPSLKATLRVRFVNDQGLDEAGIDQDGVFKEFLEILLARLVDPSLSLFKVTSEQLLYPSSSSDVHENHLALFDFAGRMLGKAVYEGLVVDVPLAPFFLSQILGRSSGLGYSSFDELPSLDPELYKSLTYVKHYDGDVGDLGLTLCWDEDALGSIRSHDLVPGGSTIPLTNDNRISYIHHMAHFRMHKQIKEQVTAFGRGFRSMIGPAWSSLFAVNEFQRLISGESEDLDLGELRRHTQYYGGFHNSHRVINWLWDLLQGDFTPGERRLFLRFVTSRSKPPLLGWAELEPAFSIRCVEVGEEEDTGDTLGSVLRGFLAIRPGSSGKAQPQARLPTSSTCFNLLKLPNYARKSTLRDKLRYAIHSNTGFELS